MDFADLVGDAKNGVVYANIVYTPDVVQCPSWFTEYIEKELELAVFEKLTGMQDANRYKLLKQQSAEALSMARSIDDGNDGTHEIVSIRRW